MMRRKDVEVLWGTTIPPLTTKDPRQDVYERDAAAEAGPFRKNGAYSSN
jgi:hypothetical protein